MYVTDLDAEIRVTQIDIIVEDNRLLASIDGNVDFSLYTRLLRKYEESTGIIREIIVDCGHACILGSLSISTFVALESYAERNELYLGLMNARDDLKSGLSRRDKGNYVQWLD